jgi:hypothetical protein
MAEVESVAVSPRHEIRLAIEYRTLFDRPQKNDYVVRTLEKREANGVPLVVAQIVISGRETRERHPLAATYPLHFKKTYFRAHLGGDPKREFQSAERASTLVGSPPPIGYTEDGDHTFRSCIVPGVPLHRLTPFGVDPEDRNVHVARELEFTKAAGLWGLLHDGYDKLRALHAAGMAHGDTELKNFIACPAPLELVPIDFEGARFEAELSDTDWAERIAEDFAPLLKEAVFLQCALGKQQGPMAEASWLAAGGLFKDAKRFADEAERRAEWE